MAHGKSASLLALCCLAAALLGPAYALNGVLDTFNAQNTNVSPTGASPAMDTNPYGMAYVTMTKGRLRTGDVLISNWNDVNGNPGAFYYERPFLCRCLHACDCPPAGCHIPLAKHVSDAIPLLAQARVPQSPRSTSMAVALACSPPSLPAPAPLRARA